jgi:hypothetical protein
MHTNIKYEAHILENIQFTVDIAQPFFVEPVANAKTATRISTGDIMFDLSEKQFCLVADIISVNQSEGVKLANAEQYRRKEAQIPWSSEEKSQIQLKIPCIAVRLLDCQKYVQLLLGY